MAEAKPLKVLIGTPTAGGVVKTAYPRTVLRAAEAVARAGGTCDLITFDGADLVLARNALAAAAIQRGFTHLLSLDSDMAVEGAVFDRLIAARRGVVAAIYTERRMDMAIYAAEMAKDGDHRRATALAARFTAAVETGKLQVTNELCRVRHAALGASLIAVPIFHKLTQAGLPTYRYQGLAAHGLPEETPDWFGRIERAPGEWLSEDYSFCRRCAEAGIDLWGYVGPGVGHVGEMVYEGAFVEQLKTGRVR